MTDFLFEKIAPVLYALVLIAVVGMIPYGIHIEHKKTAELQTILKNECGMEYSHGEVRRNGENLSRICGLKNAGEKL